MQVQGSIDFTITERTSERVVGEMPVTSGIKNPFGTVHAGAILWFADVAATVLVIGADSATQGMKGFPVAIALNANLLGNQQEGTLKAVSSFVKRGRTISVVRTAVYGAGGKAYCRCDDEPRSLDMRGRFSSENLKEEIT